MLDNIKNNAYIRKLYEKLLCVATLISPEFNTRLYYHIGKGKKLNLKKPEEFSEKLMWLKLRIYNHSGLVARCSDKYAVREYVASQGYESNLIPLIAVYSKVDDIEWEKLPTRFALKLNYGCGFNIICNDYNRFNRDEAKEKLCTWMKTHYYLGHSEMQYKDVKKRILVEEYIESCDGIIPADYKFYCFNGEPKYLLYCTERNGSHAEKSFYDIEGHEVDYKLGTVKRKFIKPGCYSDMISMCKALSAPFPFVRVDLYDMNGKVVFGELTFTPAGGTGKYTNEGELTMGSMIALPKERG